MHGGTSGEAESPHTRRGVCPSIIGRPTIFPRGPCGDAFGIARVSLKSGYSMWGPCGVQHHTHIYLQIAFQNFGCSELWGPEHVVVRIPSGEAGGNRFEKIWKKQKFIPWTMQNRCCQFSKIFVFSVDRRNPLWDAFWIWHELAIYSTRCYICSVAWLYSRYPRYIPASLVLSNPNAKR